MFETKKTLIVVYKDELLINQLKKMVETHDDGEQEIVGTRDDSINIISWTEKVWLDNKKAGNIQGKILFLGDIKGTDKLIPILDLKIDECGVRFGWAGNQGVLYVDPKMLKDRDDYDAFLEKLYTTPVPALLKNEKDQITGAEAETDSNEDHGDKHRGRIADHTRIKKISDREHKQHEVLKKAKNAVSTGADAVGKVGNQVAAKSEEMFRNKALMKKQMLFYGVIRLYYDGLEAFMNS